MFSCVFPFLEFKIILNYFIYHLKFFQMMVLPFYAEYFTIYKTGKDVYLMPALQLKPELFSLEQYEALPEDVRAEVFDGEIYDMASPTEDHQIISMELSTILNTYIKSKKGACRVFHAPFDVKLNDNPLTIVQPDLMIVCDRSKLDGKRCNGAPDFIIEIVSPGNPADDYIRKLFYYKNFLVREYWIVDPRRKTVTVNFFEENIVSVPYTFDSIVKVNIFDDLYINFAEISKILSN